ncbi:Hypothetical protein NTJ_12750 [Nesidiocoris tenuis]|uniref:F5/8 type C domain-containing protein n=1 Tax=Nesidiocoris tenuis TaxID=355587 RepID=A0ABN7B6N5_9HEMI|nr:Hypothetical protein NTJ_12750 [Nesidiocoris tenuis]
MVGMKSSDFLVFTQVPDAMGLTIDMKSELESCTVSSVQNRDVKQFSKKHLFDGDLETCWSSDQGLPQWISINLKEPVALCALKMQFQGGFAGQHCSILADGGNNTDFYPEDNNSVQSFQLPKNCRGKNVKITFNSSTDFFGRIVIYGLWLEKCEDSCEHSKSD